jgi:hypothetical protein
MHLLPFVALALLSGSPAQDRPVEKDLVISISGADLKGGIVSEMTWDGGLLVLQGIFAGEDGQLTAEYLVVPARGIELKRLSEQSQASSKYWQMKSNRVSPTGLGRIASTVESKLPLYGVGDQSQRFRDAISMGGTQQRHILRLGPLVLHDRTSEIPPYDGETFSWSPPELGRIAYVDAKGDLWVASADGSRARRLLRGDFTLPAWSDDGRIIAVVERKDNGRRWDVSVVYLPEDLRTPPR